MALWLAVPGGYSQGDLHHQCHRILEQCDPQSRQEAQAVSDGRFSDESGVSGDQGGVEEMDHADPELESGAQPVYDRLRRPADQLCLTRAVTQKYLQAPRVSLYPLGHLFPDFTMTSSRSLLWCQSSQEGTCCSYCFSLKRFFGC